jgi:hypothetical protein
MTKSHFNDEFLVLMEPTISRFLHVQMRKKIKQNNKGCVLLSYLWLHPIFVKMTGSIPFQVASGMLWPDPQIQDLAEKTHRG